MPTRSRVVCLCSAAGGRPPSKCWSTTGRDSGWQPSVCPKDAFAGGRRWQKKEPRSRHGRCACIKRRCCSRRATPTSMPLQSGGRSSEGSSVDAQTFLTCVLKLFLSHCCHERGVVLSGPEHQ